MIVAMVLSVGIAIVVNELDNIDDSDHIDDSDNINDNDSNIE